jgi:hypothetical protein
MKISGIASAGMIIMLTISISGYAFTFGLTGNDSADGGDRMLSRSRFSPFGESSRISIEINIETLRLERRWGGSLKGFSHEASKNTYPDDFVRSINPSAAVSDNDISLS